MTSFERYVEEITAAEGCRALAAIAGIGCAADGRPGLYPGRHCEGCARHLMKWAAAEYVPEIEPGAPVFVSNNGIVWVARRYAGYRPDRGRYLTDGGVRWKYCKERQEGNK